MPSEAIQSQQDVQDSTRGLRVGIVMDGNGRWATARGVSITEGHRQGGEALKRVTNAALELGVAELTVYGFSTENFARSPQEVAGIMELFIELVSSEAPEMKRKNARMCFMGRRDLLSDEIIKKMDWAENLTADGTDLTLCIAFAYGGRAEIIDALKRATKRHSIDSIDEDVLQKYMYRPELSDPDLIIRTAGENRISNFLLWQSAYAEFVSTEVLWPDFALEHLSDAIDQFRQRDRRFGTRPAVAVQS